ncbi:MAG TPA: hypothetical protein VGK06_05265 [Methanosarcina sp.]
MKLFWDKTIIVRQPMKVGIFVTLCAPIVINIAKVREKEKTIEENKKRKKSEKQNCKSFSTTDRAEWMQLLRKIT